MSENAGNSANARIAQQLLQRYGHLPPSAIQLLVALASAWLAFAKSIQAVGWERTPSKVSRVARCWSWRHEERMLRPNIYFSLSFWKSNSIDGVADYVETAALSGQA
jgi:hypothetical protein